MEYYIRGKVFNQWITDLPTLIKRYIKVQKSSMSKKLKKKELDDLSNRRMEAINDIRTQYNKATNGGILSIAPNTFPFINKFIKTANKYISNYPEGAMYLNLIAEELIALSINQTMIAKNKKKKSFESKWGTISYTLQEIRRKIYENARNLKIDTDDNSQVENEPKITFDDAKAFNKYYFRPCSLPALNTRGLNNLITDIYNEDPTQITLPNELINTPINTIINYYSILREATPITSGEAGCGTVGMLKLPYPIAYNFLSAKYKSEMDYKTYISSFNSISHINLVRLIEEDPRINIATNKLKCFVELECIYPPGNFQYSYGTIDIIKEDNTYKIDSIQIMPEDFFCAPYHYWQHNAELSVKAMYGNWCNLISVIYPTVESKFLKNIYVYGTNGNSYLFVFMKLTNGTDVQIGTYKLDNFGKWKPLNTNPCEDI